MARRGSQLGERFQRAVKKERAAQQAALADQEEARATARAARDELLDDLEAFGQSIDAFLVTRTPKALEFETEDRFLRFQHIGLGGNVGISFSGSQDGHHRLYREEDLANKWVWFSRIGTREDRTVLFDAGLEELVVTALELPAPDVALEDDDEHSVPTPTTTRTL